MLLLLIICVELISLNDLVTRVRTESHIKQRDICSPLGFVVTGVVIQPVV